jgi:hypothetical protein
MVAVEGPMVDPHHHRTAPHRTARHRTASHRTTLHCTALHCTAPHGTAPHRTAPHRIAPHRTASRRQTANLVSPHQATSLCLFGRTFPCIGRSVDEQHGRHDANGYSTILDG